MPEVGLVGAPQRLQNCAPSAFCAPHLLQKKFPFMTRHYKGFAGNCKAAMVILASIQNRSSRTFDFE
jgi:hypothetical protein